MNTQTTRQTATRLDRQSGLPYSSARPGTQFVVILDAAGKPFALAPMSQLKSTAIPADRIRIVRDQQELAEIWK